MIARIFTLCFVIVGLVAPAQATTPIQQIESPLGIDIWLVETDAVPVIAMEFAFAGGIATDPVGQEGRANLTAALLTEGAGDLDSRAFQETLQENGIRLGFNAATDSFTGGLKTTTQTAELAFDLLRLSLTEPRFEADAVDRVRGQIRAAIRQNTGDPGWLSRRAFYDSLWGDHPYGRPSRGTLATLGGLMVEDLRTFMAERLTLDQLLVTVVGDVDADTIGRLVDEAFGGLPGQGVPYAPPPAEIQTPPGLTLVERQGVQSTMLVAQGWIMPTDADWEAAVVLNHILGGGSFSSRLVQQVREDRGLTYGISSFPAAFDAGSLLLTSSDLSNGNVAEVLAVLRGIIRDLATEGPTEAEVADAKAFLIGAWPLRFTSTDQAATVLLSARLDGQTPEDLNARNERYGAVTVDDVRRVAAEILDPDGLVAVVVGPGEGLTPDRTRAAQELVDRELAGG